MVNLAWVFKIFFNGRNSAQVMQDALTSIVRLTVAVEETSATRPSKRQATAAWRVQRSALRQPGYCIASRGARFAPEQRKNFIMSYDHTSLASYPVSTPGDPAVRGPAGWHPADDIPTVAGLLGTFMWNERPFFLTVITFSFVPRPGGEQLQEGTYTIRSGLVVVEQGEFAAMPNNPAVGYAAFILQRNTPMARIYAITGMFTDSNWHIYFMLLNRVDDRGIPSLVSSSARRIA